MLNDIKKDSLLLNKMRVKSLFYEFAEFNNSVSSPRSMTEDASKQDKT